MERELEARRVGDEARVALNDDAAIVPINWYDGERVHADGVEGCAQRRLGWIRFGQIRVNG